MFVKKFAAEPFVYSWGDGSYSCYDALVSHVEYEKIRIKHNTNQPFETSEELRKELLHNLCYYMCLEFISQTQFSFECRSYVLNDFLNQIDMTDVIISRFKYSLRRRVRNVIERYNEVKTDPERAKWYLPEKELQLKEPIGRDINRWRLFTSLIGKNGDKHCNYISEINQELTDLGSDFRVTEEYYSN